MERTTAFGWSNVLGTNGPQTRSVAAFGRRGLKIVSGPVTAIVLGLGSPADAQVLPWPNEEVAPPWNAQQIFEPSPLPKLTDPDTRENLPPEDTPVRGRLQPGYEPAGIRSGSWMFNPSLITGGFFDSNVFASNTDIRSDVAAVVEPQLRAYTLWERHGLDLKLDAQETVYKENSSLNQTNASLKGNGWIDIAHDMQLLGSFQIAHFNEGVGSLSSPANAIAPTPYNWYSGDLSFRKEFNRLTTTVGFRADSYDFGSTVAQNGTPINQDARDGQIYSLHSRIDYAFSETLGWFGSAEGNVRELRGQPLQPLSSQGYRALTGVTLGLARLITGEIGFGYVQQSFVDPTIGTIEGPTYRARLTWSPTRMIDVHFNAEQIVTETSTTSSTGVLASAVQLGLDYEFRRNVIVSFYGAYESDRFFGQPRKDQVTTTDARIKYLLNRFAAIAVYYRFTSRESNIPTFSYDKHLVGLNVTTQF
jgi:hypothetical protein